jgi:Fic-DOC domain mobile mystery protein B
MGLNLVYIEVQTPLDEEEKEGLLITTISTREELDEFEQYNIEKAIQWIYSRKLKKEQLLSEKFIKELHKKMYSDVWRRSGKFRTSEKNLGIASYKIATELKILMDDCLFWIENNTFEPVEIAVRFKHKLVSIHCFSNGNGRHSRLMADLIMEKFFGKPILGWGRNNLVQQNNTRDFYIKAVKLADKNEFQTLIEFAQS